MSKRYASDYATRKHVRLLGVALQGWVRGTSFLMRRFYDAPSDIRIPEPAETILDTGEVHLQLLHWAGRGEPILALHGLSGVAWSWSRLAALMSPEYDVYAFSMRGHGKSSAPEVGYTLEHTSADILTVMDRLGLARVHLAGESWGGKAAMHFAAAHPDRLHSLLLADPVLPQGLNPLLSHSPSLLHAGLLTERLRYSNRDCFEKTGRRAVYLPVWDAFDRSAWEQRFVSDARGGYSPRLPDSGYNEIIEHAIQADIEPLVRGLSVPTLYMQPTWSIAFWPGETRALFGSLSDITVSRVLGDHTFIASNPHGAANAMKRYLNQRFEE